MQWYPGSLGVGEASEMFIDFLNLINQQNV